jgi:chorismate mutase-like protein
MTLQLLRRRIDRIDSQLLRLLNRRAGLAIRVGRLKRRRGGRLFDPARERAILRRLAEANGGPLSREAVRALYREILRQTRRVEQSV